jgi:hypothetical protein
MNIDIFEKVDKQIENGTYKIEDPYLKACLESFKHLSESGDMERIMKGAYADRE